jgi:type IV secretory pathway TrbD component
LILVNVRVCVFVNLNPSQQSKAKQSRAGRSVMFFDNVVFAGVLTVGLMVLFFAGFGFFIWKDAHKRRK